ncbi:hypothetical protein PIB30_033709 [Stylosanthes scabra]|uniref:Uncharacterized protein n=1 Tax=Stylosanthes scabra TaxID=79078 RepID=A0ABU6XAB9_9FABA|nr:hypothetical protein [Stylosanthes scabra]
MGIDKFDFSSIEYTDTLTSHNGATHPLLFQIPSTHPEYQTARPCHRHRRPVFSWCWRPIFSSPPVPSIFHRLLQPCPSPKWHCRLGSAVSFLDRTIEGLQLRQLRLLLKLLHSSLRLRPFVYLQLRLSSSILRSEHSPYHA